MASWKKYFKVSGQTDGSLSPVSGITSDQSKADFAFRNYQSSLPEVYSGHPNRVERYNQYEAMDMDSEVNACLDIISEFSTQQNKQNGTAFEIEFADNPTDHEVEIIKQQLQHWNKLNKFDQRTFKLFRNTIKYGDQVFVRDPETFELFWVDMMKVSRIIVNESEGKKPEQYIIRDINPNFENLTVAAKTVKDDTINPPTQGGYSAPPSYSAPNAMNNQGGRFATAMNESCIDAAHVCHLSLSEGLDWKWPFGQSILENIYKVFKQKELLEDAILIYRVQRAPERRIFKIDVGNMPSHMAMAFVERIKNEIHQRRIPTTTGGTALLDATYNPLSMNEDYFFPQTADGRGSSVETLPGGQNLGEIDDLRYFNNKLSRGLRVPSSYLPTGPDESMTSINDGRVGTALIQEYRFNQYCQRMQNQISQKLNDEFKMFLRFRGFNIDNSVFNIKFNSPQNFASYRQAELDTQRVNVFSTIEGMPYVSKRFALERFLGLTAEEIQKNQELWSEENGEAEAENLEGKDLRSVGVSPGDIDADMTAGDEFGDLAPEEGEGEGEAVAMPGAEPGTEEI
jgi:hypothetical protein